MAIEIKQMQINATISLENPNGETAPHGMSGVEYSMPLSEMKRDILNECRHLFRDLLEKEKER